MGMIPHGAVGRASARSIRSLKAVSMLGAIGVSVLFALGGAQAQSTDLPEGPGKAVVQQNCTTCHGAELITAQRRSADDWSEVVNRMLANGAQLTDDQHQTVLAYLGTYVGTTPAPGGAAAGAGTKAAPAAR